MNNTSNSSSNPFRRSAVPSYIPGDGNASPISSDHSSTARVTTDELPILPKASTATKRVRITTPPRSRSQSPSFRHVGFPTSIASQEIPPAQPDHDASPQYSRPDHSLSDGSSSGDDDEVNTPNMAAAPAVPARPANKAPYNPFSRTLATMEESLGVGSSERTAEGTDRRQEERQASRLANRASMDVNAFKNLLMTGKVSPDAVEGQSQAANKSIGVVMADNSSSTDTSSISRQSIMENVPGETPRTSYEQSRSEDEKEPPVVPQRTPSKRVKPPPPKHRYGRSVNGPQIVSFAAFSDPSHDASSPVSDKPSRTSGEFKRPLPPIPIASPRHEAPSISTDTSNPTSPPVAEPDQPIQPKKPPPPPLARRSSHRAPIGRPRSGTGSSRPSLMEDNESIAESTTSSTRIAPPPPPTRRSGNTSSHSATTDDTSTSPATSLHRTPSIKSPPPVPAPRHRTGSNTSATSVRPILASPPLPSASPGTIVPPPPPPRRTSSRSSVEILSSPRRTSAEMPLRQSFDSERRQSGSRAASIAEEGIGGDMEASVGTVRESAGEGASGKDILADMDAFQREIDALMGRDGR